MISTSEISSDLIGDGRNNVLNMEFYVVLDAVMHCRKDLRSWHSGMQLKKLQ